MDRNNFPRLAAFDQVFLGQAFAKGQTIIAS